MKRMSSAARLVVFLAAVLTGLPGCAGRSGEAPETEWNRSAARVEAGSEEASDEANAIAAESAPLRWHDWTARARAARRARDYEEAVRLLDQAAILVGALPPRHVRRRTVFASRVRLADEMLRRGDASTAAALARALLAEGSQTPALAGPALGSLALSIATAREGSAIHGAREALGADRWDDAALLRLALQITRAQPSARDRLAPTRTILLSARSKGLPEIGREAADLLLTDARRGGTVDGVAHAEIRAARARFAIELGDVVAAGEDIERARNLIHERGEDDPQRGRIEALRAELRALEALAADSVAEPGETPADERPH